MVTFENGIIVLLFQRNTFFSSLHFNFEISVHFVQNDKITLPFHE